MILVTGAMGRIGTAAVAALHARRAPTRALVPSRCQVPWLSDFDTEYVEGDGDDPRRLQQALAGVKAVILIARPSAESVENQQRVIESCAELGVARVVKLSVVSAGDDAGRTAAARWHRQTEQLLLNAVAEPCIVRTGRTMQDLLHQAPLILAHQMVVGCQGTGVTADADARDVGAVLAGLAVTAVPPTAPVLVTGPMALTRAEAADRLGKALGLALRYVTCTPIELEQLLLASGISRWQVDDLVSYETAARDDRWSSVTDAVQRWGGGAPRTFEAFANELAMSLRYQRGAPSGAPPVARGDSHADLLLHPVPVVATEP